MELTAEQLAALKAEIVSDPSGRGYAGKSHEDIAKMLRRADRTVDAETLDIGLFAASITKADRAAMSSADRDYLGFIVSVNSPTLPLTPTLKAEIASLFQSRPNSRARIVEAQRRNGSRLDELGLPNHITESDVADVLREEKERS